MKIVREELINSLSLMNSEFFTMVGWGNGMVRLSSSSVLPGKCDWKIGCSIDLMMVGHTIVIPCYAPDLGKIRLNTQEVLKITRKHTNYFVTIEVCNERIEILMGDRCDYLYILPLVE